MIDEIARYLTDGYWEAEKSNRHTFDVKSGSILTADITALTEEGQQLARWALEAWTNVTGIKFEFVADNNADIIFDDNEDGGFSNTTVHGGVIVSSHVNVTSDWLIEKGNTIDSFTFYAYIHEIGHALGLGHPGPYGSDTATYGVDNLFLHDSWQFSVMSYFSQSENTNIDASDAYPITPMIADVVAIQNLYGAPIDINAGDTVYGYESNVGGYLVNFLINGLLMMGPCHQGNPPLLQAVIILLLKERRSIHLVISLSLALERARLLLPIWIMTATLISFLGRR